MNAICRTLRSISFNTPASSLVQGVSTRSLKQAQSGTVTEGC